MIFSPTAILLWLSIPAVMEEDVIKWHDITLVETNEIANYLVHGINGSNETILGCVVSPLVDEKFELHYLYLRKKHRIFDDQDHAIPPHTWDGNCYVGGDYDRCVEFVAGVSERKFNESGWSAKGIFFLNRYPPFNQTSLIREIKDTCQIGLSGFKEVAQRCNVCDRISA